MDKQIIRLTESDLHNIVRKSVNRILKEGDEEWKSPLDKVRKNRDWKEINKNKIQVPNRPKKAKPTTLGDLPQFEKLKNLNVENYIHNIVKETVKRKINEVMNPGSVSHGTMRNEDILPEFMSTLFKEDPQKAQEIWQNNPDFLEALCDKNAGIENPWWESEDATYMAEELFEIMDSYSPEGHYFGAHPGDGSDYGYWPNEEE